MVSALWFVHSRSTAPRFVQKLSGSELIAKRHYLAIEGSRLRVGIPVGSVMAIWDTHPRNSMGGSQSLPCTPGPAPRGFPRLRAAATSGGRGPELHV